MEHGPPWSSPPGEHQENQVPESPGEGRKKRLRRTEQFLIVLMDETGATLLGLGPICL
jgi:hypothetical protein